VVNRVDQSQHLGGVIRQDGMLRVQANLTRTGIFKYQNPDGSTRREYRPESEVFHADSLASFAGRPLTIGHRLDAVDSTTWREVSVGDVRDDAHRDGTYVRATVQVNDANTIRRVDSKELVEVSCGYRCDLDNTPGTFQGQPYDAVQRNIRLNHVALLPPDHGRAGPDVKLLLDSSQDVLVEAPSECPSKCSMTDQEIAQLQIDLAKAQSKAAEAEGKAAAAQALADQARKDAKDAAEGIPAKVQARVALEAEAKRVHADIKCDGKTDAEIMREVVTKLSPTLKVDGDDALRGAFQALAGSWDGGRKNVEQAIAGAAAQALHADTQEAPNPVAEARARNYKRASLLYGMTDKDLDKAERKFRAQQYEAGLGVKGGN
jgi:hypothetical protein